MNDVAVHSARSISDRISIINAPYKLVSGLWVNRGLLAQMTRREITRRYKGSLLGLAWSFFNPLLMLSIYTFFFAVVFKSKWGASVPENKAAYAIILFAGLIMHSLMAECINTAPTIIVGNVSYVKRVVFPLEILPCVSLGSALFHALISLIALVATQLVFMHEVQWTLIYLPLVFVPLILEALGISWILASLGVYVRDVSQITGTIVTILLFLSPVFYPVTALPEAFRGWMSLNPMTFIIGNAREVIVFGHAPDMAELLFVSIYAGIFAVFGYWWFQKTKKGFADVL